MSLLGGVTLALFVWLVGFQAALALGVPIGRLAWGGRHPGRLPRHLRRASAATLPLLLLGIWMVLRIEGVLFWPDIRATIAILWSFAALFCLSVIGNLASTSPAERRLGVPVAAGVMLGCAGLALRGA